MHPHETHSSNPWPLIGVPLEHDASTSQNLLQNYVSTKKQIQILSVGRTEPAPLIRDALRDEPDFAVSIASDYRELWIRSKEEAIQIALLHNSLCSFELDEAIRLVRSRWPNAKILIIRSGELLIDRAAYDDRLLPSVTPEILRERILKLAESTGEEGCSRGH